MSVGPRNHMENFRKFDFQIISHNCQHKPRNQKLDPGDKSRQEVVQQSTHINKIVFWDRIPLNRSKETSFKIIANVAATKNMTSPLANNSSFIPNTLTGFSIQISSFGGIS